MKKLLDIAAALGTTEVFHLTGDQDDRDLAASSYSNNLYIPVRERIFTLARSKALSQKNLAKAIKISPQVTTDWKAGRNFSFMRKLKSIAGVLDTTEVWLLTGKDAPPNEETVKQIEEIADSLGIHLLDLLGNDLALSLSQENTIDPAPEAAPPKEVNSMKPQFGMDPALLDDAAEVTRFAIDRCEADACALARLDTPEARELAQERLRMAKKAEVLMCFFAQL